MKNDINQMADFKPRIKRTKDGTIQKWLPEKAHDSRRLNLYNKDIIQNAQTVDSANVGK